MKGGSTNLPLANACMNTQQQSYGENSQAVKANMYTM